MDVSQGGTRNALSRSFEEAAVNPQLGHGILNKLHNQDLPLKEFRKSAYYHIGDLQKQ